MYSFSISHTVYAEDARKRSLKLVFQAEAVNVSKISVVEEQASQIFAEDYTRVNEGPYPGIESHRPSDRAPEI